jgi:hypothetical protein
MRTCSVSGRRERPGLARQERVAELSPGGVGWSPVTLAATRAKTSERLRDSASNGSARAS